jgi:exonuclease VII large subunit
MLKSCVGLTSLVSLRGGGSIGEQWAFSAQHVFLGVVEFQQFSQFSLIRFVADSAESD